MDGAAMARHARIEAATDTTAGSVAGGALDRPALTPTFAGSPPALLPLPCALLPVIQTLPPLTLPRGAQPSSPGPACLYLASLAPTGRRSMAARLRRVATLFGAPTIEEVPWEALRYAHVVAILVRLAEDGLAPASINATLAALRGVMNAAWSLSLLDVEDLERIRRVKGARGSSLPRGRAVAGAELAALLAACDRDSSPAGARDAAMIALLYTAGLRREELASLDLADLSLAAASLTIRHAKGRKQRLLPLASAAIASLVPWLAVRGTRSGGLFLPVNKGGRIYGARFAAQAVYRALAKRAEQAGLAEPLSPHDLRRTFVGDLLDAGADIATVQQLAGHASVSTTARYDRRGEATKRRAVELLSLPVPGDR